MGDGDTELCAEAVIRDKIAFLKDYRAVSGGRALAFNYTDKDNIWDTESVTGLERRAARLLGIRNLRRRNLFQITYQIYDEKDSDGKTEYRFRVTEEESGKILLSSSARYATKEAAESEMRVAVSRAMYEEGFERGTTREETARYYFNVVNEQKEVVARRIEYFKTAEERETAIRHLVDFLVDRYSDEGLFVVEHILLRPHPESDAFLPVCTEPGCIECEDSDPYSFRVSIILPAYSKRFADIDFRRFAEKTIRLETPAHVLPRICWISQEQMGEFEKGYHKWLQCRATGSPDEGAALSALVETMSRLRSLYPEAYLYDPSAEGRARTRAPRQNQSGHTKGEGPWPIALSGERLLSIPTPFSKMGRSSPLTN